MSGQSALRSVSECKYFNENRGDDSYVFQLRGVLFCANLGCAYQVGSVASDAVAPSVRRGGLCENTKDLSEIAEDTGISLLHSRIESEESIQTA